MPKRFLNILKHIILYVPLKLKKSEKFKKFCYFLHLKIYILSNIKVFVEKNGLKLRLLIYSHFEICLEIRKMTDIALLF